MKTVAAGLKTTYESARPQRLGPCAFGLSAGRIRILAWLLVAVAGTGIAPARLPAQGAWRFTPHIGGWLPVGPVRHHVVNGEAIRQAQVGDILVGARVGRALSPAYWAELTLAGTPGQVARTDILGTRDIPALALLATARVTRQTRLNSEFDGHFVGGVGVIRRSGRGWGGSWVAPTLVGGFGIQTMVGSGTAFKVEVEVLGSRYGRPDIAPPSTPTWRADVVVTFGVVFPAIRRGRQDREGEKR